MVPRVHSLAIRDKGLDLAIGWPTNLPVASLTGPVAEYRDVMPGVDLRLRADAEGFEKTIVVKTRAAAALVVAQGGFRLPVTSGGLSLSLDDGLNLRARDQAGNLKFVAPAPRMWDSSLPYGTANGESGRLAPVSSLLRQLTVGSSEITLVPDLAFLADPNAVFPIYIDPGVTLAKTAWTLIDSSASTTSFYNSAGPAKVGTYNGGAAKLRSAFAFPVEDLRGKHIVHAQFNAHLGYSQSCTPRQVDLWKVSAFSASTTWANPFALQQRINAWTGAAGFSADCPAKTIPFDVTPTVQATASAMETRLWLAFKAADENDTLGWKKFTVNPQLSATWDVAPTLPVNLATDEPMGCIVGTGRPTLYTTTPTMRGVVHDDDGDLVQLQYELRSTSTSAVVHTGSSGWTANGDFAEWTSPQLSAGTTYNWRARATDGTLTTPWTTSCEFTTPSLAAVNTAPASPTSLQTSPPAACTTGDARPVLETSSPVPASEPHRPGQ